MSALSRSKLKDRRRKAFRAQLEKYGQDYTLTGGRTILGIPVPEDVQHDLEPGGFKRASNQGHTVSFGRWEFDLKRSSPEGMEVTDADGARYTIGAYITEPGDPELRATLEPKK